MKNSIYPIYKLKIKQFLFIALLFVSTTISAQQTEWAITCGGPFSDKGISIGTDSLGYIYISGYFNGEATFGSHTVYAPANNSKDFFVAKMDSFGTFLWAASGGAYYDDRVLGMDVDKAGNVYVTGTVWNSGTFGSVSVDASSYGGNFDASVLAKLDTDGNWLWAKSFGAPADNSPVCPGIPWHGDDHAYDVKVDDDGFIFITGFWSGTNAYFDGYTLSNPDWYDRCSPGGYIGKLDPNGNFLWVEQYDGIEDQRGSRDNRIAIDEFSNVYVTGGFDSTGVYGPFSLPSNGGWDVFLCKLDTDGNWIWAKNVGSNKDDRANGIAVDDCNDVYITGEYRNPMVFAGANASNGTDTLSHKKKRDVFVAKITSDGDWQWAKRARSDKKEKSYQMSVDKNFNSYIGGETADTIKFNNSLEIPNDDINPFVAQLDNNGNWEWVKIADSPTSDSEKTNDIAVDNFGNAYAVGYIGGNANFDGINVTTTANSKDIFVWRIKTVQNTISIPTADTTYTISYSCDPVDTGVFMEFDTNVVFCTEVIDVEIDSVFLNPQIIETISIGTQSACDFTANIYTQEIILTYSNGGNTQINVNGQLFTTTASPQTITLQNLNADGQMVNIDANFITSPCITSLPNAFIAPQNCFTPLCAIDTILMGNQSICDFTTNTYTQEVIVTYPNTSTGQININGQLFASTGSPQTITLQNLTANGQGVNVTAYFVNNSTCVVSMPNAFTAPQDCYISSCPIDDIVISDQSICDEMTNTYSQELILYYDDEPSTGEIDVNGQLFTITSSPQTITLTNLQATGEMTDIFAQFTFNPTNCIYVVSDAYASPNSCGSVGIQHQFIEGTQVYSYDNTIVVDLSETIIDGITQVDIFSIIGQLIEQGDIDNNNRVQYQLNNQATGHYIVRLVNDDKHASYKVFIER